MENSDLGTGTVGRPMTGVEVALVDWEEGQYRVRDHPRPRGEVCLSGDPVAQGYFNLPERTSEAFHVGKDGKMWLKTGDIGEFDDQGNVTYSSGGKRWTSHF